MRRYRYKAIRADGRYLEDVLVAENEKEALQQIRESQLFPVEVQQVVDAESAAQTSELPRLKTAKVIQFTHNLHTLIKAGIPILAALKVIHRQTEDEAIQQLTERLIHDISVGKSFSEALRQFSHSFSQLYISTIEVGEVSGTLEETLFYLTNLMKKDYQLKQDIKKALRYPIITIVAIAIAFLVFTVVVFPKFIPLFQAAQLKLPMPTRILMGISGLLTHYGFFVLALLVAAGIGLFVYFRKPEGKRHLEGIVFQLPIFGSLVRHSYMARFSKMLFTLFKTGIPLLQALEIVRDAIGSHLFAREITRMIQGISEGKKLADIAEQGSLFDEFAVQMFKIGEESGALEAILNHVAEYYEKEVADVVGNLNSLIEPILTVVLGGMVLFLALSLLLPMWDLINAINHGP